MSDKKKEAKEDKYGLVPSDYQSHCELSVENALFCKSMKNKMLHKYIVNKGIELYKKSLQDKHIEI